MTRLSVSSKPINRFARFRSFDAPRYARISRAWYIACSENLLILMKRAASQPKAMNPAPSSTMLNGEVPSRKSSCFVQSPDARPNADRSQLVSTASATKNTTTNTGAAALAINSRTGDFFLSVSGPPEGIDFDAYPAAEQSHPAIPPAAAMSARNQIPREKIQFGTISTSPQMKSHPVTNNDIQAEPRASHSRSSSTR